MSLGERDALTGLIATLIVIVLFVWLLTVRPAERVVLGPDGLQVWSRPGLCHVFPLIAILVSIVPHIACARVTGDTPDGRRTESHGAIDRRARSLGWHFLFRGILGVIIDVSLYRRGARRVPRIQNRIRRLRLDAEEMTRKDLADRAGVTRLASLAIKNGTHAPSLDPAFRTVRPFGVPLDRVLTFHDD